MPSPQLNLGIPTVLPRDAYDFGERASGETHGVVLTKPHVVRLILDLAGYKADKDLAGYSLLEPACGHGAFVLEAATRLLSSAARFNRKVVELRDAIAAFDVDLNHVEIARKAIFELLTQHDISNDEATEIAQTWIRQSDLLLEPHLKEFDFVVGNPPYIRIEQISPSLQAEYRRQYSSLYDRADIYVAFIERGVSLLSHRGILAYICADRWIVNKYGSPLRRLLTENFAVKYYVDLHRSNPFDSAVIAYPSIFVISRGESSAVKVGSLATASPEECDSFVTRVTGVMTQHANVRVETYESWFKGDEPWVISTPAHLKALRELENRLAPLERFETKVGIGVATGSDKVFIVDASADIEQDRLVPLVMRDDIQDGKIRNANRFVINAFEDSGQLIDLSSYPKLAKYLFEHEASIRKRHVAQRNERGWFRTIDRVYPSLVGKPKLLIPDIAGSNEIALDTGRYHPHHNLYFVTSNHWDIEILGGLLSSKVALFFIWSYAVKMRGGYLRFQAQYLRRIRIPNPHSISVKLGDDIRVAFRERRFADLDQLALAAYGISSLPDFDFEETRA